MEGEELIEAFGVFSTAYEGIVRERDDEATRFGTFCKLSLQSGKGRDRLIVAVDNVEGIEGNEEQRSEGKPSS